MHWRRAGAVALLALAATLPLSAHAAAHSPHDVANIVVVSPDFAHDHTVFASFLLTDHKLLGRSTDGGLAWELYAPPMMADGLSALEFSPAWSRDRTIFAASHGGGVFRSTDGGDTWQAVNTGLFDRTVNGLALSPGFGTDRTLLAVTGAGCFRSDDAGDSWTLSRSGVSSASLPLTRVVFATPDVAFVGGEVVHRSADGGRTWAPMHRFPHAVACLAVSPGYVPGSADSILLVSFGEAGGGVIASRDGGRKWKPMVDGLTDVFVNQVAFADDGALFAVTRTEGCFRAPRAGAPFTRLADGFERLSEMTRNHFLSVALSPDHERDGIVFVSSFEGLYASNDRGTEWKQLDVYSQRINRRALVARGDGGRQEILLGNYGGGLITSTGEGEDLSWVSRADGLGALWTDVLELSPDYERDGTLLAGHLGLWMSSDRGVSWERLQLPLPNPDLPVRAAAFSPQWAKDRTLIAGVGDGGEWRSTDGGATWTALAGLPLDDFATFIELSPGWPDDPVGFVSTGKGRIFRTLDGGEHWSACVGLPGQAVRALALSPAFATDRTALAGTAGGGVLVTRDAGETWTRCNDGLPTGIALIVEGLECSPAFADDHTAFLSLITGGVFRSTDAGASWSQVSRDLPLSAPRVLALSPDFATDRTLVLAAHDWAWISRDAGEHWSRLPGYIRVNDNHPSVSYDGRWGWQGGPGFDQLGARFSEKPGSTTRIEFKGRSVSWYSQTGPDEGTAFIDIDGQRDATIDLSAPTLTKQAQVYTKTFPREGWHTIRVSNAGATKRNAKVRVVSDGFGYTF